VTRLQAANDRGYAALAAGIRTITLAIGATSLLQQGAGVLGGASLAALAVLAVTATLANFVRPGYPWVSPIEAALAALAISASGDAAIQLLPYITAPAFSAGLLRGMRASLWTTAAAAVALALTFYPWSALLLQQAFTWLVVSVGVGLLAGWVHLLRSRAETIEQHSYEEATVLLEDLRRVIRPLSGGLDPRPLAEEMLDEIASATTSCQGAAVFLGFDPFRELVASFGVSPNGGWSMATTEDAPVSRRTIAHRDRPIGLLVVQPMNGALNADEDRLITITLDAWSPRLEAAALYYEVRELATRAERSRLAREMHDGVAQDIASLGYVADDLAADLPAEFRDRLDVLRAQLSDVVTNLRLSIHDLRDQGLQATGLVASIAELARQEARLGGMHLHLRIQEGSNALAPGVEQDLYRIAAEALTNARRHSQAENLWVSCSSGPNGTVISIEDDGMGYPAGGSPGLGVQTMTERALRIGARLTLERRPPTGTRLRVEFKAPSVLGQPS